MIKRFILKSQKTICLCGKSDGKVFKRTFTILQKISEGASSVCYEAYYDNSGRGVLKEFYPQDAYELERNKQGQLVPSAEFRDAHERFLNAERKYTEPYEMLQNAKQNSGNQDLATFIPAFEIYHGCDEAGNVVGTTYVWTPDPKLETFDRICDEIHKHPKAEPEHKLFTVLAAMESLTKCICALHSADMIHRDIKPSNFGFIRRGKETLTQTLSMFDINSVCSVYGADDSAMGTKGYMEPEAGYETADNQTDIYSIGATLFHAIIVSDEVREGGYLYRPDYYDRIREMVDESRLIRASEANAHPRLRNILTVILQKCLCERTYRYPNCEELLADIKKALYYVLPSDIARKTIAGEKWILADVEKKLDMHREKNSSLAIQYHLYEHPLYRCVSEDETTINVLVIGFGNYGQKFLDACLQAGQILRKKLNVTVVFEDAEDKGIYLKSRPGLAEFFNIDGSLSGSEDTYGDITFEVTKLERENRAANTHILQDIMCKYDDVELPHYIFVALGEDVLNLNAACACKDAVDAFEKNCVVNYVCEESMISGNNENGLYPLFVNADITKSALYPEIERMAFNTHLVWEKNLSVDYQSIKAGFRKGYNYDSCVSNVLSIKYKLHSMDIDLDEIGFNEAAKAFTDVISDKKNNGDIKNELIWIEHRRWVTEKLCLGWQKMQNLEECAGGLTKDAKNKRHVCILRSRPEQKLTTGYRDNHYAKWETPSEDELRKHLREPNELDELDELDRMSVELHRMFMKKAEAVRSQNLLSGNNMEAIRSLIEGEKKAIVAFQEWFTCLKDIWNGDIEKVCLYKGLKTSFQRAVDSFSGEKRRAVREQVKAFEAIFYPVLESMEYRDWKQDDVALIDSIPFVLTYTENAYMIIPYAIGSNTDVFGNIAAPTVVNPSRILYLYFLMREDIQEFRESISYVVEYMRKKKLKAAVEFILIYTDAMEAMVDEDMIKDVHRSGKGRIRQIKCMKVDGIGDIAADLGAYLRQRGIGKRFFAVEKNETWLSGVLEGAGFYKAFSGYRFDPGSMEFEYPDSSGCDMLSYINKRTYITVADMAAFRLSSSESSDQPEFFDDYGELWKTYHNDINSSNAWKLLCKVLKGYAEENDVLASFKKKRLQGNENTQEYHYIVPFVCKKSIEKIISFLKGQGILENESSVNGYTTDSCKVLIFDKCGYGKEYDKLFSRVYALMVPDAITLTSSNEIKVMFDNLVVSGASFADVSERYAATVRSLMEYFSKKGYVMNLHMVDEKMSFTYATRQIKKLLTTEGKMLEVYTYHKVKELGKFDDVVSGYEINWEGTEVKNEFDCILTKGFRTLFVECKAQHVIDQNFYSKLISFAGQFGINASYVLIADTQEKPEYDTAAINAMQRKRGCMVDVVTIWKKEEINNIGHTLLKVINGKYESQGE